jgi:hypothetical protein
MTRPDYVPDAAEDITAYGAVSNPDDPSDGSYSTNRSAIIDAAKAAGRNGSIYVPSGTYYFGEDDSNSWIRIGAMTPAGISVYGDGAGSSTLALTEHIPDGGVATMFDYVDDEYTSESTTVTYRGIKLDGNAPNLPNLFSNNVGSLGINIRSGNSGLTLAMGEVHVYQTYNAGIRTDGGSMTADYCTFERSGFGIENDSGGDSIDHLTVPSPQSADGDTAVFRDCEFHLTPGNACDPGGDGQVEFYRCWGAGLGTGFLKIQYNPIHCENVYMRPNTTELESLITSQTRPFDGRLAMYSMGGGSPSVDLYDVKAEQMTEQAMYVDSGETWTIGGDVVALEGIGTKRDLQGDAFRERNSSTFEWNINRISARGINSTFGVFNTSNGGGTIDTLHWEGAESLNTTGSTTINTESEGGDPFQPNVPSQDEVGVSALSDDSTTDAPLFDDWTPRWGSDSDDWSVVSGDEFAGGNALAFEHVGDTRTRYAISCDTIGTPADVEVLDKFRVPAFTADTNLGFHARVNLRSSSSSGGENGYWLELETPENSFRLAKYTDGSLTTIGRFGTPEENTFYYRRFRAEGNKLKAKVWRASENEPAEWDIETTDGDHADGWVGLGSFDTELVETSVFSVATGGETAPHLDSDASPGVTWQSPNDGETVSGTTVLEIDAADQEDADDSLAVEYRVDGGTWQSASYNVDTGYYEDTWDTTGTADGDHTLEAKATDSAGNSTNTSVTVAVDNSLSVETIGAENITDSSTTLVGDVTRFGGADEATCYFEWREQGTETWNTVGEQTRSSLGEFSADLTGLNGGTSYEFQAVAETTDRATGSIQSFDTATDGTSLSIDRFDLTDKSNPSWSWYDIDWTVSDVDGQLDTVVSELRYNGNTVAAESTSVSGETASFTHELRVKGDVDEVRLSVNDTSNNYISESKQL